MDQLNTIGAVTTALFLACTSLGANTQQPGESHLVDARDQLGTISKYIAERKANFAIEGMHMDMFGKPQDPKRAQVIQQQKKVAVTKTDTKIPLQEILNALPITMIDPLGDRVVLKGNPPMSKGETLALSFQGQSVILRFEGSRSTGAYFREMKTKKLGLRKMIRLPKGIKQGSHGKSLAGGIHEENSDKPRQIKLDLNFPGSAPPN